MENSKSKKSRSRSKKKDKRKLFLSSDKPSTAADTTTEPSKDQNSKTVQVTDSVSADIDRDADEAFTVQVENTNGEIKDLLEGVEQSVRAVKDSSEDDPSIEKEAVDGTIAPSNSPLPPAEQSDANQFKAVQRRNAKKKRKSPTISASEAASTDSTTDKSGTSGVVSYSTSLEDIAEDKPNHNLADNQVTASYSACTKHAFHQQHPTAPPALADKPALCDACSQTMLSYISVVQEFLEGLALDISQKVDPSNPCLQYVKERLMPPRKQTHSATCEHFPSSRTVDATVGEQRSVSTDSSEQKYRERKSKPSHLDIGEVGDSTPTTSDPSRLRENVSESELSSQELRDRAKVPLSSQTEETSRLPIVGSADTTKQRTDVGSHKPKTEHVPEVDSTSKQLDFLYKFENDEYANPPLSENNVSEQRKEQTFEQIVQQIGQYSGEISQPSSDRQTYSYLPSAHQPKQGVFAALPDRWPVPQPAEVIGTHKAAVTGRSDFPSPSPYLSHEPLQRDATTISGAEREVYDSARGLAGWESMSDLQDVPDPVGPRITSEAYVTMASSNAEALGCLVLGASLLLCGTSRTLAVLVTDGVSASFRPLLSAIFHVVQPVRSLDSLGTTKLALLDQPELGVSFGKLHVWRLAQFSKCVYLNPDTLVVRNCDELFCHEELSAVPDIGWPDCFNSGVFVFSPSVHTFWQLVEFAENRGSYDGGDQGLLNTFFNTWSHDIHKKLSFIYNLMANVSYTYSPAFKQFGGNVKIIQFQGSFKPWHVKFHSESGQIAPSSNVHPTFIGFVKVWINVFRARIVAVFPSDIQGFVSSNTCYSASELLRFFPSPVEPDVEFLLTPPSVRSYPSPKGSLHLGNWARDEEDKDSSYQEDKPLRQPSIGEVDFKGLTPTEGIASDEGEDSSVFLGSPDETLQAEETDNISTQAVGDKVTAEDAVDSELAVDAEAETVAEDGDESNPIPGSEMGDYEGMMAWEQGRMDYLGHDSSENILRRLHFLIGTPNRLV